MIKIVNCKYELKYDYYVTEEGHVWSDYSHKFIRELPDKNGYLKVRLSSTDLPKGKQHAYSVHRLVLENFKPCDNLRAEVNGAAKLTKEQVKEIIQLLLSKKYTYKQIGEMYNVGEETIGRIKRKKSWKELTKEINFN